MRRLILSAVAASALGLSALAPPASAAPVAVAPVAPGAQEPLTEAQLKARADTYLAMLQALVVEIETIRADTSLTEEDRQARMQAAIDLKRPEIYGFATLLASVVRQDTLDEGGTVEEADAAAAGVMNVFGDSLVQGLLSGELAPGSE